jgi:putative acetyltransferase
MTAEVLVRDAQDSDGPAISALVAAVFAEYPGCLFEPAEFPELHAPASYYAGRSGKLWVAQDSVGLIASLAVCDGVEPDTCELAKVYATPATRGTGLSAGLLARAFDHARQRGARELVLWTDTRFARGHAFYAKHGFMRMPGARFLHDVSATWEYHFRARL